MKKIFVGGDSTTFQADSIPSFSKNNVFCSVLSGRDTFHTVKKLEEFLVDPLNVGPPTPGLWDVIRFNCGVWDCQPLDATDNHITTADEFRNNLKQIIAIMRGHSPRAKLVWSISPLIGANRLTLDPPPATGLLDIDVYNAALMEYRSIALSDLPAIGVIVDDACAYYHNNTPADFGLTPDHENTGSYWRWDGIHWDVNYRAHESERIANVIDAAADTIPKDGPSNRSFPVFPG